MKNQSYLWPALFTCQILLWPVRVAGEQEKITDNRTERAGNGSAQLKEVTLSLPEGDFNMVNRDFPSRGNPLKPVILTLSGEGTITLKAFNILGEEIVWEQSVNLENGTGEVAFDYGLGYYRIEAARSGNKVAELHLGVIPPYHPGVRERSLFCSNTSHTRFGEELDFLQRIGMKVQRVHIASEGPGRTKGASILDTLKDHGNWILPIVGYSLGEKSKWAREYNQHGPPADFSDFVTRWERIVRDYAEVKIWEFWNEPWIFGWTWADTPYRYRELQVLWSNMALDIIPEAEIIVGNSWMFTMDHIKPYPHCWKHGLVHGTSHHPYVDNASLNWRSGAYQRALDATYLLNEAMGLPYAYITEGGASVASPRFDHLKHSDYETPNNILNAAKIPQLFTYNALAGMYQANMQWEIGYGPDWTMSNTSFAVFSHFTEDRPVLADIWPENELITGAIFAHPKFINRELKQLPRADEISARWDVPVPESRADDNTKVAILFSNTGADNFHLDRQGQITIPDAGGLKAYNLVAEPIPAENGQLVLPFGQNPMYLVTEELSVIELYEQIKHARLSNVTALNLYATSLTRDASLPQKLRIRCVNQINKALDVELSLKIDGHKGTIKQQASLPAGKLTDVYVDWPGVEKNAGNQYAIALEGSYENEALKKRSFSHRQIIQQAMFARRTIAVDGDSDDWKAIVPVTLNAVSEADEAKYMLNPSLESPDVIDEETAHARLYMAYDEAYLYFCLKDWGHETSVGELAKPGLELWKKGQPDGLNHIADCGDVLQLAFGFRERVPHMGRQPDDPFRWKGHYYDTDYQYAVYKDGGGNDHVMRQWGPDTDRRTAYQIDLVPYVSEPEGVQVKITKDCYELAIPRSELSMFDPGMKYFRFDFLLNGKFQWARSAGVFDFWKSNGSYAPSWKNTLPCQDFFGIE